VIDIDKATARAMRQMKAVLFATQRECDGDPTEILATLIGTLVTFCSTRKAAAEMLTIAINSLELAKVEVQTGAPMLKPSGVPS
jgi:hypothetical protein